MDTDPSQKQLLNLSESTEIAVKGKKTAIVPRETEGSEKLQLLSDTEFQNRQLGLFQTFLANTDEQRDRLSNAMDLWDSVPRYSVSRQAMNKARIQGEFLREHEMTFQHRG